MPKKPMQNPLFVLGANKVCVLGKMLVFCQTSMTQKVVDGNFLPYVRFKATQSGYNHKKNQHFYFLLRDVSIICQHVHRPELRNFFF